MECRYTKIFSALTDMNHNTHKKEHCYTYESLTERFVVNPLVTSRIYDVVSYVLNKELREML